VARAHAAQGHGDQAFAWLDKALEARFAGENLLDGDTHLARLHTDPRWSAFTDKVRRNARPCAYIAEFRQWDFWVGRWQLESATGQLAGINHIQLQANGCYLLENWASARGGFNGQSLSFWDAPAEQWVQVWADSTGQNIVARGGLDDAGSIVLEGEFRPRTGKITGYRGTWTPLADGRVRQHLEQSTDEGQTWKTWFDGYYERIAD